MARRLRKVLAALEARQRNAPTGKGFHKPGSQNAHKTGLVSVPRR